MHILVMADACTDQTVDAASAGQAQVISISARNVGMARAAGVQELLRRMAGTDPAAVWLATTDADSLVPGDWLRRQLAYANQQWDVVLGTVTVADWEDHPAHVTAVYQALYEFFDLLHRAGQFLLWLSYTRRRELLEDFGLDHDPVWKLPWSPKPGEAQLGA